MQKIKKFFSESTLLNAIIVVIVLLVVMCILNPTFLSLSNLLNMSKVVAVTATVSFGMQIIIGMGGLNLSVGTTGAMCAVLAGGAMEIFGVSTPVALIIGLAAGILAGFLNGLLVYRAGGAGVAFFLITLATSYIFKGITLMITEGFPFNRINPSFLAVGSTTLFGTIPLSLIYMIIFAVFLYFMFNKMKIGRQLLAFGANYKAAELYGVSKFKVVCIGCTLAGFFSGAGGLLGLIRIQAAQPNMGNDWMLLAFAATLIGGTSLTGGRVNVLGTILGAFALVIIDNALVYLIIDTYWTQLIYGLLVLGAVSLELVRTKSKKGGKSHGTTA